MQICHLCKLVISGLGEGNKVTQLSDIFYNLDG